MGRSVSVETYVTVNVELEELNTDDLIEELEKRGQIVGTERYGAATEQLIKIYQLRRTGRPYDAELGNYISDVLGKVV
jgi:hypothetical protein